jgi:hypothetical protein
VDGFRLDHTTDADSGIFADEWDYIISKVDYYACHVERAVANGDRFGGHTYVMTALETHDELRLLQGTGFNLWTGAGFWGIGATTWSTRASSRL